MSVFSVYTKRANLAESLAVRWWGVTGARRFWLAWGAFTYAFLVFIAGYGLPALARTEDESSTRFIFYLAVALIVLAASLLTRMLLRVMRELHSLESSDRRGGSTNDVA